MSARRRIAALMQRQTGVDIGDDIPYSCMLDFASTQYLTMQHGGVSGNRKAWTVSFYMKLGQMALADNRHLLMVGDVGVGSNPTSYSRLMLSTSHTLVLQSSSSAGEAFETTRVLRDPAAWFRVTVAMDNANTVVRCYVDDEETAYLSRTNPSNTDGLFGRANYYYRIGIFRTAEPRCADGYFADFIYADGQVLTPSSFLRTSADTLEPVHKDFAGSYGTYGWHLDFANDADLGNDVSGNNLDWTANNMSSANRYTDTPTNNHCVLNAIKLPSGSVSIGNTKGTFGTSNSHLYSHRGTMSVKTGKWVWEVTPSSSIYNLLGVIDAAFRDGVDQCAVGSYVAAIYANDGNKYLNSNSSSAFGSSYTTGVMRFELDCDAGELEVFEDNVSQGTMTLASTDVYYTPFAQNRNNVAATVQFNFGARPFAHTPTAGFNAICTANMEEPSLPNPTTAFQVSLAAESSIYAQVAADIAGWSDYATILKNRSNTESWAWTFSHDASNEYAVAASSVTRQSVRAMSGSDNWVAYSIRIGAAYGSAAGSVVHTNGVASTVTHNVGVSARQLILLFPRAGGSAVPVYHPDVASGELLDLCTTSADAASTAITSVGANSFQVGSGVASGTYDYLVCSELEGLLALNKHTGNSSTDGPMVYANGSPALIINRDLGGHSWNFIDADRNTYNVAGDYLRGESNIAENASVSVANNTALDILSNGFKLKNAAVNSAENNGSGSVYANAIWLKSHIKYSTAR